MSHLEYYNNVVASIDMFRESHKSLLEKICNELGHPDKIDELSKKYIDETIKLKAKRDENMPRRPKNGYLIYLNEVRDKHRKKHPKKSMGDITKLISQEWNKLNEEKRKPYNTKAQELKEEYEENIKEYKNNLYMNM
jgi:hypothetical protein